MAHLAGVDEYRKAHAFVSGPIPFVIVGNRRAITGMTMLMNPEVAEFVKAFPDSFEPAYNQDAYFFIEPDMPA